MPPAAKPRPRKGGLSRAIRWLVLGVPVLLVCLVALIAGAHWWLQRFLQGEEFRQFLNRKASAALQAEARIEPLHWQGSEVYSAGLDVRGSPQGPLTAFQAEDIRAQFNLGAIWRRVWRIDGVDVQSITAEIGANNALKTAPDQPAPENVAPPGAGGNPLADWLPNRIEIGEVRVNDFALKWATGQPAAAGNVSGVHLVAHMHDNVRDWDFSGHGGRLTQAHLPPIDLDSFAIKTNAQSIFITHAGGRSAAGGEVNFSGTQSLTGAKSMEVAMDYSGISIDSFLPPDWRGRLHGKVTGNAHVSGSPADAASWHSTGHIDLREGDIEALPVLDELAIFTASARYRQATVQRGTADFVWAPNRLQVNNLLVESEGLLRVQGSFVVTGDQIDGTFQVGVAVSSIKWLAQIGTTVFNQPQHDGYMWTTMHLAGPLDNPHEDLSGRMVAAATKAMEEKAQQGANAVIDTASGLLDLLRPPH